MEQTCGVIRGTDEDNTILGTQTPDFINGYGGDDLITGFGGDDILIGGTGADRFAFSAIESSEPPADDAPIINVEIRKHKGEDPQSLDKGTGLFSYSFDPMPELLQDDLYHDGFNAILDFSRSEGDRIDLSKISAGLKNGLKFSGTTPEPYAVYYVAGIKPEHDIVTGTGLAALSAGEPILLVADMDGDIQTPEIMTMVWGWIGDDPLTHIAASDFVL